MTDDTKVTPSSGNVFADLDLENPEEQLLKSQLVREIRAVIKRRRLTQAKAGELMGLSQSDVSSVVNGRVYKFSLERLLRCVRRLDQEVALVIRPKGSARVRRIRSTGAVPAVA